ncbi:X-ray radiation resistance-associated protein 1 [Polymixia lowei]
MMSTYKFDVGNSHPSNCFPVRAFFRQREEGAGHWLVAHRKTEERYTNVHTRKKHKYNLDVKPNQSINKRVAECDTSDIPTGNPSDIPTGNTLNGPFLIRLQCVDKPSELCSIDISEQRLNSVKPEDLKDFDSVAYVNASVNSLSLESFSNFMSLRELDLSLNGLCNMTFNADNFPHLEVLDLSYNNLSADDIVSIGLLARLKVLHLTGNQLLHLPHNLGSSHDDLTPLTAKEEGAHFRALEVLMLDDNKLSSGVFSSLANLRRLRHLNLQGNYISEIPYLQLSAHLKHLQTSIQQQNEEQDLAHTESNQKTFQRISEIVRGQLESAQSCSRIWFDKENSGEHSGQSNLPLPELQFLNLADNKIAEEEALLAVALFPMLNEIVIHSNPLTTRRSGDPPLLTRFLQERLGITIQRKKTPETVKPSMVLSTNLKRKVGKRIPRTQVEQRDKTYIRMPLRSETKDSLDETDQKAESFFVTQATGLPDYEVKLPSKGNKNAEKMERNECDAIPEKFKGCEMLMVAKPNPDVMEPTGIQPTVRILEQTLKNLIVYRDSKPKLDSLQKPYRQKEKRIENLPPLKSIKTRGEKVEDMLKEIKETKTFRGITLSSVLDGTGVNKQEHEEAVLLLKDMKKMYKMVYVKTVEQASLFESERNTNQK